jgi:hypothetical protein
MPILDNGNIDLEKGIPKMTETPNPPYDLASVLAAANTQNLVFVGRESTELLAKQDSLTTINVVMFPYSLNDEGEAVIAAGPRRGTYTGKLISSLLNEKMNKGRFVFEDGTVIYRDSIILE